MLFFAAVASLDIPQNVDICMAQFCYRLATTNLITGMNFPRGCNTKPLYIKHSKKLNLNAK